MYPYERTIIALFIIENMINSIMYLYSSTLYTYLIIKCNESNICYIMHFVFILIDRKMTSVFARQKLRAQELQIIKDNIRKKLPVLSKAQIRRFIIMKLLDKNLVNICIYYLGIVYHITKHFI